MRSTAPAAPLPEAEPGRLPWVEARRRFKLPDAQVQMARELGIDGVVLSIEDVDLLDGTPVLDIKPYVGEFDARAGARVGWLESARKRTDVADD